MAAYELRITQRNSTDTASIVSNVPPISPGTSSFVMYNGATNVPKMGAIGAGLSWDGITLTANAGSFDGSYTSLTDLPELFSGDYDDLTGKPTLSTVATSGAYSDLSGKPTLFDGMWSSLTGKPSTFTPSTHTHVSSDISDSTSVGRSVLMASDAGAARTAIGAGTSNFDGNYSSLTNKPTLFDGAYSSLSGIPSTFTPSSHNHSASDITSGTLADARIPSLAISKTTGLQTALDACQPLDSDLTAIAALTTTSFGRSVLTQADAAAVRTLIGAGNGSVTSVVAGTGLSGGTITTSGTISMPNTGTAGSYSGITTDAQGRVIEGTTRTFNNNVSRSLNSNYTISSTRDVLVSYSINATWSLNALLSGTGTAFLEYSTNAGSNWTTVNQVGKTLNLLTVAGSDDMNLTGVIPTNALVRIRTTSTNMTISYTTGQEIYL